MKTEPTSRITLERFAVTEWGTLGKISLPNGHTLATLEPPPFQNKRGVSCIPCGLYNLVERESLLMRRLSQGKIERAWFLADVPDRTAILIHPGNTLKDTSGCILAGTRHAIYRGVPAVINSRLACAQLAQSLYDEANPSLLITWPKVMPERL